MMEKERESKQKILVIDDEADIRLLFEAILEGKGFEVLTASDGLKGIKINEVYDPDLIILDLIMPQLSGIDTLREIRKTDRDVVIIVLTAYGSAQTIRESLDLNVHEYISKPADIDVLLGAILEALSERKRKEHE